MGIFLGFFAVVGMVYAVRTISSQVHEEYCPFEAFNASCAWNEVIMMTSALYGRMKIGRCVPFDYFVGCATDVLDLMETKCSGRENCVVHIPDTELFKVHPCRKDLVVYLEASYTCITVSGVPKSTTGMKCKGAVEILPRSGYLASSIARRTGHGSSRCPWMVEAPLGQRIEVYMYDFSSRDRPAVNRLDSPLDQTDGRCPAVAMFREESGSKREHYLRMCPMGMRERRKVVYSSHTNKLLIHLLNSTQNEEHASNLVLYFEVTGCPDPEVSGNVALIRKGEILAVFCNYTGERWHLVCKDNHWIGAYANCSKALPPQHEETTKQSRHFPIGLLVAIAIGVLVGVITGFILLLLIFTCKRRLRRSQAEQSVLLVDYENQKNAYKVMEFQPPPIVLQHGCDCVLAEFRAATAAAAAASNCLLHSPAESPQDDPSSAAVARAFLPEVYFSDALQQFCGSENEIQMPQQAAPLLSYGVCKSNRADDMYNTRHLVCTCNSYSPGGYRTDDGMGCDHRLTN